MFEEAGQVLEFLQRADQFLQVLQPARRLGRFVGLQHGGIAAFVQHRLGQFGMRQPVEQRCASARSCAPVRSATCAAWASARRSRPAAAPLRTATRGRRGRCRASPAAPCRRGRAWAVDDALERQIVVGLHDDAQIGHGVADFLALVEARAADDAIGQAERDEPLLEFARLEAGAHQDGDLAQRVALALQRLDLLADRARFLLAVPHAAHD